MCKELHVRFQKAHCTSTVWGRYASISSTCKKHLEMLLGYKLEIPAVWCSCKKKIMELKVASLEIEFTDGKWESCWTFQHRPRTPHSVANHILEVIATDWFTSGRGAQDEILWKWWKEVRELQTTVIKSSNPGVGPPGFNLSVIESIKP